MAVIGNSVQSVPFITDTFSGNASTVNFTLTRAPAGTASIAVFISGVYQAPTAYSLIGDVITFGSAPATGTNNLVVLHLGNGSTTQVPSDGSVTTPRIADGAVTGVKLGLTAINANNIVDGTITLAKISSGVLPTAIANSAAIYANGAFAAANAAIATDTTQNNNITAAFTAANTPSATANSAAIYANGAFTAANTKAATASPTFTGTVVMANANTTVINVQSQLEVYGRAFQNIITLADVSTITMNLAQTNNFSVTLGGNRTLANVANSTPGQSGFIVVRQDGTGSRTLSFGTGWRFPTNSAPTLTTTANAVDLIVYTATTTSNVIAQALLSVT